MRYLAIVSTILFAVLATSAAITAQKANIAADPAKPAAVSASALQLRLDMRKLWSDHVIWTRDYIIAATGDTADQKAAADRLLKNQDDIGAAIAVQYGKEAGDKLAGLLREHITIAVDLIAAAKAKDDAKYKEADGKWRKNAGDIAEFLSKANANWPRPALTEMMMMHLDTTVNEVKARLDGKWDDDVKAFDVVYDHILKMADTLSDGIIAAFPERFAK